MSTRIFSCVAALSLLLDQATKFWARSASGGIEGRSLLEPWPGVFELKLVFNKGIAFGLFQGAGTFLTPIAAVIAVGAAWYSVKHPKESRAVHVTMALLCAGALGNLIDRLAYGRVTDMFWIRAINFPVFNVADVCITVAGVLLALSVVLELFHGKPTASVEEAVVPESGSELPTDSVDANGPGQMPEASSDQ